MLLRTVVLAAILPLPAFLCMLMAQGTASAARLRTQLGGCETPRSAREGGVHVQVLLQAAVMDQSRMVAEVLGGPGF